MKKIKTRMPSGTMKEEAQIKSGATAKKEAGIGCRNKGQREVADEALREVLVWLQRMRKVVKTDIKVFLVTEDWDWLVIMECLQDHGMFKVNPERMPYAEFETWMQQMPQYLSECSAIKLARAGRTLHNARYPWKGVDWNPHVLVRWRALYQILSRLLDELNTREAQRN